MKGSKFIFLIGLFFLFALSAALIWDAVSSMSSAIEKIEMTDNEMRKQEEKVIRQVRGLPTVGGDVTLFIERYEQAARVSERHAAYEDLAAAVQRSLSAKDTVGNPMLRRLSDEIVGAFNRREIIKPRYEESVADYTKLSKSVSGGIAKRLSTELPENLK